MIKLMEEAEWRKLPMLVLPPKERGSETESCYHCDAYRPHPQFSGNLQVDPEIHLPSPGMDIDIAEYYNSGATSGSPFINTPFGYQRTMSPAMAAQFYGAGLSSVILERGTGAIVTYAADGFGNLVPQTPGVLNTLVKDVPNGLLKETTPAGIVTAYPLDLTGQPQTVTYVEDAVGNRHTYAYSSGILQTIQDAVGRFVSFSYSSGLLQSIQDWANRRTTFQYDTTTASPNNLLTTVIGPTGCQTAYQYSNLVIGPHNQKDWLLTGIIDPNGYGTSYTYDTSRRVSSRTVQGAGITTYSYIAGGMQVQDALGNITTQMTNSNFAPTFQQNALGYGVTFTRNSNNLPTSVQYPDGSIWTSSYDASGNRTGTIDPLGSRNTATFDAFNNPTSIQTMDGAIVTNIWGFGGSSFDTTGTKRRLQAVVNQLGYRTSYGYTGRGQLASVQNALGFFVTNSFDNFGNRVSTQDAMGGLWSSSFDLAGNIIASMNPLGNVWSTSFDNQNRPLVSVNPLGATSTVAYDSVGNRTVSINPLGFRTSTTFNVFDKPVAVQNALGAVWTSVYDNLGRGIASIDPLGNRSSQVWDTMGSPVASINPLGFRSTTVFDIISRPVARQDALGYLSTRVFDAANRTIAKVDALGSRASVNYDYMGRTISTQNALGYLTTTIFDVNGHPIANLDAIGNRTSTIFDSVSHIIARQDALGFLTTNIFDGNDRRVASQDALGRLNTTIFDNANRRIANLNALGFRWTTNFDAADRSVSQVDALARTSTAVFDAAGQTVSSISPLGYRTSYIFDSVGRNVSVQDANNNVTSTVFDIVNRSIGSMSSLGIRTSIVYDTASQPISMQDGLGYLHTSIFDAVGKAIASINPLNYRYTSIYSATGKLLVSVDALGNRSSTVFDAAGHQIATQCALGYLTTLVFDAIGRQTALVDANSRRMTNLFNSRGDLVSTQDILGALTSWQYDPVGNTILRVDARNWPTSYTVDALNRTIGQLNIDGTRVTNTFDLAGQQLTSQDLLGVRSFGYDLDGRKTNVAFPTGLILTMGFDPVSNRISLLDPDNGLTSWSFDSQKRIVGIQNPLAEYTTIQWDSLDRELHKVLANGMTVSHTFNAAGREILLENRKADGTGLAIFTNTYDSVSNRLTVAEIDGTLCTFGYDPTYQLTLEQRSGANSYNTSYVYDPVGNRLVKYDSGMATNYQVNTANELVLVTPSSGAPTTSMFDANGNLSLQNTGGAMTTYSWDPENRLLSVSDTTGVESYSYSADGLRQQKINGAGTTNFMWDEQNLLQERDGSLAKIAQYTDFPGYWGGLVSQCRSNTSGFHGFDSQSSSRIMVSIGDVITDNYSYKAFGEELASGGSTINPHRYVGQYGYYRDSTIRLQVRARELEVVTGRWISRDKRKLVYGGSSYAYVLNRTLQLIDPSGDIEIDKSCFTCDCSERRLSYIHQAIEDIQLINSRTSESDWKDILDCAKKQIDPECALHGGDRATPPRMMACMNEWINGKTPHMIYCYSGTKGDCKDPGFCSGAIHCQIAGFSPGDMVICVDKNFPCDKPDSCHCDKIYKPSCNLVVPEPACGIVHEMIHCCGFDTWRPNSDFPRSPQCLERWTNAIACCYSNRFHTIIAGGS